MTVIAGLFTQQGGSAVVGYPPSPSTLNMLEAYDSVKITTIQTADYM